MTKIYSKLDILVLFSKISNDKKFTQNSICILHISLKSQNYKITSMKTQLVEGFSVSRVLYKNTIFCGKILPLGDQKRKSNASSIKDFFWKKEKRKKRKKKKGQMSSYFSRKKNLEILPEMLNGSKNRTPPYISHPSNRHLKSSWVGSKVRPCLS
jgi:hypothetical protein